jgi:predicted DNA-binding protein
MAKKLKVTFTLDEATVQHLRQAAKRSGKPQSLIVREAVAQYGARDDQMMTPEERLYKLKVFDELVKRLPKRPDEEIEAELAEIRAARRAEG